MKNSQNYAGWSCRVGESRLGGAWVSQRGKQEILRDQDRVRLSDSDIITIGATTLILRTADAEEEE